MENIKKIVDAIRRDPKKMEGKSIIIGIADEDKADLLFMGGDKGTLIKMLGVFLTDIEKRAREEYLN